MVLVQNNVQSGRYRYSSREVENDCYCTTDHDTPLLLANRFLSYSEYLRGFILVFEGMFSWDNTASGEEVAVAVVRFIWNMLGSIPTSGIIRA